MISFNTPWVILSTAKKVLCLSPTRKWLLPCLVILGLAAALADSLGISLIVLFLYSIMGRTNEMIATSGIVGRAFGIIIDKIGSSSLLMVLIVSLVVVHIGLTFTYALITAHIRYRLSEAVRNRLSKQYLEISYDFILRHDQGQLLKIWTGESWVMGDVYLCVGRLLINTCSIIIFIIFLSIISWKLLLVSATGIAFLLVAMHFLSEPARNLGWRMRKEHENIAERMLVTLQGMRALRAFAQEQRYQHGFEVASAQVRQSSIAFEHLYALVSTVIQIGYLLLLVVIVLVGDALGISFVATLAFVALLYRLQPYVRELESNLLTIAQLDASVTSVMNMLDRSDKVYLTSGTTSFGGLRREIRCETLFFTSTAPAPPSVDQCIFTKPAGRVTT